MEALSLAVPMTSTVALATSEKFVVAYDFSPCAQVALDYALDLAVRQHAEVILVHAQHSEPKALVMNEKSVLPSIPLQLGECLERTAGNCRTYGIEARSLLKAGSPVDALKQSVAELKPAVIFLGAYGASRLDREELGSTAESLLHTLPCPVVTIGPRAVKRNTARDQPVKVVCPIDFPEDVHGRLKIIAKFAKALCAEIKLVHAVDICNEYSRPHNAADTQFELDLLVGRLLHEGVAAQSTLLYGSPEAAICEYAQAENAQYIMFGLHKSGFFSSYFRKSLVARVIRNAPCAILTYPQPV